MITWLLDGYVIAEHAFASQLGLTAGNVMIGYMDTFSSIATPEEDNFVIFDNVRVISLESEPPPALVTVTATDAAAAEPGADTATLEFTREGNTSQAVTVNFRTSGTASATTDYQIPRNAVTI